MHSLSMKKLNSLSAGEHVQSKPGGLLTDMCKSNLVVLRVHFYAGSTLKEPDCNDPLSEGFPHKTFANLQLSWSKGSVSVKVDSTDQLYVQTSGIQTGLINLDILIRTRQLHQHDCHQNDHYCHYRYYQDKLNL